MKLKRQSAIKDIILKHEVDNQVELGELLFKAGFDVTQATISRDIREMRLTKTPGLNGRNKYVMPARPATEEQDIAKLTRIFYDGFVSMDYAGNMLVIHTVSGMAMAVGAALDAMNYPEILGTVAGDDVVMCVIRTSEHAALLMEKLRK